MKTAHILFSFILLSVSLYAQDSETNKNISLSSIKKTEHRVLIDEITQSNIYPDTNKMLKNDSLQSLSGSLLTNKQNHTKKGPWWKPALGIVLNNFSTCAFNKYILKSTFCRISFRTVRDNFRNGLTFDDDGFGVNFEQHPYNGAMYFNQARTQGYNFWESIPFALGGSLMWEYTMENTRPSYNDLINTTITGASLGEMMYRLSSVFLNGRVNSKHKVPNEFLAALINPVRFKQRLMNNELGKLSENENEVEPLDVTVYAGIQNRNEGTAFWKGKNSMSVNFNLVYGNPFEKKSFKPYDFFKFTMDLSIGIGRKFIDNMEGYGLLFARNPGTGNKNTGILLGVFQHYDFWDSKAFQIGSIALGGGFMHRTEINKVCDIVSQIHLGIIPLGAMGADFLIEERNYDYGGGLVIKASSEFNLGLIDFKADSYLYGLHTYIGTPGNNFAAIVRARAAINIAHIFYAGFEYLWYGRNSYLNGLPHIHAENTVQKFYIMLQSGYFKF